VSDFLPEFCAEHPTWRLNVAHVFFMQETKFKDSIKYYEPIVESSLQQDSILSIQAIVLANLCVGYIMTSQNDRAEELMREIEKEEEILERETGGEHAPVYHLCIVNMVIGTLYCSKANFEFGIGRVTKSLEPIESKLSSDTWFYAKRCLLALSEALSKHMIVLKDVTFHEILEFLDECAKHGKDMVASVHDDDEGGTAGAADPMGVRVGTTDAGVERTVQAEAQMIKTLYLKLKDS